MPVTPASTQGYMRPLIFQAVEKARGRPFDPGQFGGKLADLMQRNVLINTMNMGRIGPNEARRRQIKSKTRAVGAHLRPGFRGLAGKRAITGSYSPSDYAQINIRHRGIF